jgi:hypothetical protein
MRGGLGWLIGRFAGLRVSQCAQLVDDLRPFAIERGQSTLQDRNLSGDVVRVDDGLVPFNPSDLAATTRPSSCRGARRDSSHRVATDGEFYNDLPRRVRSSPA